MLEGNSVMMVLRENNPHHSWLGLTEQQNLTLFRGRAWMPEVERPKALSTDAYKWSQKVGAGRTERKRPRLHGRKANKAFI